MIPSFENVLAEHMKRYPLMQPQDYTKLAYQSEFGPAHLAGNVAAAAQSIREEWEQVAPKECSHLYEPIGEELCRFWLRADQYREDAVQLLAKLFCKTARSHAGNIAGLFAKLEMLKLLRVSGMHEWVNAYYAAGCPAVHHSRNSLCTIIGHKGPPFHFR